MVEGKELQTVRKPFFSVVVPNYNGEELLPTVLEALRCQTFQDFEAIVVDDASVDKSVFFVETHYPGFRIVINNQNQGFSTTINNGTSSATGRYIVLLNTDTEPEPQWLHELAKGICAYPHAGIYASKVLLYDDPAVLHTTGDYLRRSGVPGNRGVWEHDTGQYDACTSVFSGSGCAVAYRSDLWEALGGYDEDFWMYLEDVDFAFRANLLEYTTVFVPEARVLHKLTATAGGVLSSYYVGRNTIWLIVKNMPSSLLRQNLASIVAGQLQISWDAVQHFRGSEARARLRGQLVGLFTLRRMLHKRAQIQKRRTLSDETLNNNLFG